MPLPEGEWVGPAVPRGWKVGSVVPLHSAALGGGGFGEEALGEVFREMAKGSAGEGSGGGGKGGKGRR